MTNSCELCESRPAAGYLCAHCALDTAERLEQLPEIFEEIADLAVLGRALDGSRRGSRPAFSPTPNLRPLAVRWGFSILPSWHRVLAEDSGWPQQHTGFALAGEDTRILGACIALRASMDWIAASWIAAGAFAEEVKELFADAISATGTPDLPARMGLCPTKRDGVLCGSVLRLPHGAKVVVCRWCKSTYPPGTWAALRLAQDAAWKQAS